MPGRSSQNHHWPARVPLKVLNHEASAPAVPPVYEFGPYRLGNVKRALLRDGEPVPLTRKALEMLTLLVQHRGRVLEKDELLQRLWADTVVEEANLTQNIYLLRKALGQCARGQSFIETVPKRGYRFVADVKEVWQEVPEAITATGQECGLNDEASGKIVEKDFPAPTAKIHVPLVFKRRRQYPLVIVALTICLLCALAYALISNVMNDARTTGAVKSLAVLPFKPIGAESRDARLGLGIADATITKLSGVEQFSVLPTSAVFKFSDALYELQAVGRELGVDAVLEGTVQRAGDRVRVSVRLTNVTDNQLLWAERFDASFTDVFAVQDAVSEQVASALKLKLIGESEQHLARREEQE